MLEVDCVERRKKTKKTYFRVTGATPPPSSPLCPVPFYTTTQKRQVPADDDVGPPPGRGHELPVRPVVALDPRPGDLGWHADGGLPT